ncbi:MAG: HP0268 family nuclease [Wolinella sp.]
MDIKLARTELEGKGAKISIEKLKERLESKGQKIFYFDKENSHKDLMSLIDHFEKSGKSVYFREIRYGLNEGDYMYEVHII